MAKLVTVILAAASLISLGDAHPSSGTSKFYFDLYKNCFAETRENVVISPLSIGSDITLLYKGAKGKTATEIETTLGYGTDLTTMAKPLFKYIKSPNSPLAMANKMYVKSGYEIKNDFQKIATESYDTEIGSVDFADNVAAAEKINGWVKQETKNKIRNVKGADSLSGDERLMMVNAVHFKGVWKTAFEKDRTQPTDFWTSEEDKQKVDMMYVKGNFKYAKLPQMGASAVELPFSNTNLSMVVILPDWKTGLIDMQRGFFSLYYINKQLKDTPVNVYLPKFKVEYEHDLVPALKKMGVNTLFTPEADLTNAFNTADPMQLSKVVHKTVFEVDEEGMEAADSTALNGQTSETFLVDRPFLYAIKDLEGYAILWGSMRLF